MAKNEGKKFEEDFQKSIPQNIFCHRIKDSSNFKMTTKNLCDFIVFNSPHLYLLELKSTKQNQISMDERIIKEHQVKGLYEASKVLFIVAGFIINYRGRVLKTKTVEPETYFIPSDQMIKVYENEKYLHKDRAKEIGVLIPQKKLITRYRYDIPFDLINKI